MRALHYLCLACAVGGAGCARKTPPATPAVSKPASSGRLVPAVIAGFEHGVGSWRATGPGGAPVACAAQTGGAARGNKWLAVGPVSLAPGKDGACNLHAALGTRDWSRFGDSVRADVRITPPAPGVTAELYVNYMGGRAAVPGPELPVTGAWKTLLCPAATALKAATGLGVLVHSTAPWHGTIGLDNVRIGAAAGLNQAFSVVFGPFSSREAAVQTIGSLQKSGVSSFPIYEEGWYLNLGTFRSQSAATMEAGRLRGKGLRVSVLVR